MQAQNVDIIATNRINFIHFRNYYPKLSDDLAFDLAKGMTEKQRTQQNQQAMMDSLSQVGCEEFYQETV